MNKKITVATFFLASALVSGNTFAYQLDKPIVTQIPVHNPAIKSGLTPQTKDVVLMHFKFTPKEQQLLDNYKPKKFKLIKDENQNLPSEAQLGMNDVPVLDQGMHGTCVTFAVTAALDALLKKGDYISQLCLLELGSQLAKDGYMPSGWMGTFGPWSIDQIIRFGVVNTENQRTKSCANVTEYPKYNMNNEGNPMAPSEYKQMSEDLSEKIYPIYRMNFFQRFDDRFNEEGEVEHVFNRTKEALNKGNRLTFGTILVLTPRCSVGACATHNTRGDTWALTPEIEGNHDFGGHEMVITGYDDNAVATDKQGNTHKGLFTLRNSWGKFAGDSGNFYMTYDYFKKYVGEVQEIVEVK